MKNIMRSAVAVAFAGFLFGFGLGAGGAAHASVRAGGPDPFPDKWFFYGAERPEKLRSLEGKQAKEIDIAEWRGDSVSLKESRGKVVVLDFWGTWCGPCIAAIPKNNALVNKYSDKGLVFIGLHDAARGWDKVDSVIKDTGINYPVALDKTEGRSGVSTKAYNVQFWPTYVVIDRNGVVRGAGLSPAHVEDAVKVLLAEPYEGDAGGVEAKGSEFSEDWYVRGSRRPGSFRKAEGKPMKPLEVAEWIGTPLDSTSLARRVAVVQFVRPESASSLKQLDALVPIAKKYARQGVSFLVICDATSDWALMADAAEERGLTMAVALDKPLEKGRIGGGVTGKAFGVTFGPAMAVVDRAGVIRAVGLKTEHLEKVLNTLLAERLPAPAKVKPKPKPKADGAG